MAITGRLTVNSSTIRQTSNSFNGTANQVRSLTNSMLMLVNSLNGKWTGQAQGIYSRKFNALDGDMAQIFAKIMEHVTDLMQMASFYEQAENANVSSFSSGNLGTDYIHH